MEPGADLLIYLISFQGIVLGTLCLLKRKHRSLLFLALFLYVLSLQIFLSSEGGRYLLLHFPITVILLDSLPFLISPFLYFYVSYSLYGAYQPGGKILFHFVPALFDIVLLASFFMIFGEDPFLQTVQFVLMGKSPLLMNLVMLAKLISGFAYVFLISKQLLFFKKELRETGEEKKRRRWYFWLFFTFVLCWSTVLAMAVLSMFLKPDSLKLFLYTLTQTLAFSVFIYLVFGFSLNYPALFENRKVRDKVRDKLKLSEKRIDALMEELRRLMEVEKAYTDPDMTLASLAEEMGIHTNVLSFLVNEKSSGNFSQFVNRYRVAYFIDSVKSERTSGSGFLQLAFAAGFNSKSSFNRVFKEQKGLTPSQYFKKH